MAKKCYFIQYVNCVGQAGTSYVCSESIEIRGGGNCGGPYIYSADLGFNRDNASEQSVSVTVVSMDNCPGCAAATSPDQPCDCVNGGCVPKTTYNTPGKYANLAACQAGCAKDSNCTGECVSSDEIAALQQAANNLQSRLCQ